MLNLACAAVPVQTYPGAERPSSEIAVLRQTARASAMTLDGDAVRGSAWAVLPGTHEVLLRVRIYTQAPNMNWTAWTHCYVRFEAVAGEHYESVVRVTKETAPGLVEKVEMEMGIAAVTGGLVGKARSRSAKRPSTGR